MKVNVGRRKGFKYKEPAGRLREQSRVATMQGHSRAVLVVAASFIEVVSDPAEWL